MPEIDLDLVKMVDPFNKPIPGQSLTNGDETQYAWDKPPKFVTVKDALDDIFYGLMERERLLSLVSIMSEGVFDIATMAQIVLEKGWRDGKWNTELLLLLAEPVMIIIMAISEKAGIRDYDIYEGERDELSDEDQKLMAADITKGLKNKTKFKGMDMPPVSKESVPAPILEGIEEAEIPQASLLEKPTGGQ
jgi:hypothetical protein